MRDFSLNKRSRPNKVDAAPKERLPRRVYLPKSSTSLTTTSVM